MHLSKVGYIVNGYAARIQITNRGVQDQYTLTEQSVNYPNRAFSRNMELGSAMAGIYRLFVWPDPFNCV